MINWNAEYFNNTLFSYVAVLGLAIVTTLIAYLVARFLGWRLKRWAPQGDPLPLYLLSHALQASRLWLLFGFFLSITAQRLVLPGNLLPWLRTLMVFFLVMQVLLSLNRAMQAWGELYQENIGERYTTVRMFIFFGRLILFTVGALFIIDNLPGVEITALVASLGIGGIAVALALQNLLSDIFASLSITVDRPFVLGDFIIVDDVMGTVENIGLKTTRLRSLSGEQLVISNNDLLSSRIHNYKRMYERRVVFTVSVTYDTAIAKLRKIPERIREIIVNLENTRFDRAHFFSFGASDLVFEVVYYIDGPDYNLYMDRQQSINLTIMEFFEQEGIEFAFPTQTLYLRQDDGSLAKGFAAATLGQPEPGAQKQTGGEAG